MASETTESAVIYKLWAWAEVHKKQLLWGTIVVVVVGFGAGFLLWRQNERERSASQALSQAIMSAGQDSAPPDALLKVAADYPNTEGGGRALLLAGGALFVNGKYAEAQAQFDRYLTEYRTGPFTGQAALGKASCLEAMGKVSDAIAAYKVVAERAADSVAAQAKLALGRLYEAQGDLNQARSYYNQIDRPDLFGTIGTVAGMRLEQLAIEHPVVAPAGPTPTNAPVFNFRPN